MRLVFSGLPVSTRDFEPMAIRVGLLTEGHDHRILTVFLAKLLGIDEAEVIADVIDGPGHGWQYVERNVDSALRRFYGQCDQLAVLSMDNDGNIDLRATGDAEDLRHPRHWLHTAQLSSPHCRWCVLKNLGEKTRIHLDWIAEKPGREWPILIAVPVESIEAWLLISQAILSHGKGSLHAEQENRSTFKSRFYGRPAATLQGVEVFALPLIRQLSLDQIQTLRRQSQSFDNFATQVEQFREEIQTAPDCWA